MILCQNLEKYWKLYYARKELEISYYQGWAEVGFREALMAS